MSPATVVCRPTSVINSSKEDDDDTLDPWQIPITPPPIDRHQISRRSIASICNEATFCINAENYCSTPQLLVVVPSNEDSTAIVSVNKNPLEVRQRRASLIQLPNLTSILEDENGEIVAAQTSKNSIVKAAKNAVTNAEIATTGPIQTRTDSEVSVLRSKGLVRSLVPLPSGHKLNREDRKSSRPNSESDFTTVSSLPSSSDFEPTDSIRMEDAVEYFQRHRRHSNDFNLNIENESLNVESDVFSSSAVIQNSPQDFQSLAISSEIDSDVVFVASQSFSTKSSQQSEKPVQLSKICLKETQTFSPNDCHHHSNHSKSLLTSTEDSSLILGHDYSYRTINRDDLVTSNSSCSCPPLTDRQVIHNKPHEKNISANNESFIFNDHQLLPVDEYTKNGHTSFSVWAQNYEATNVSQPLSAVQHDEKDHAYRETVL